MDRFDTIRHLKAAEAVEQVSGSRAERVQELFRHGSLQVEVYSPINQDTQAPHARDEAYVVIRGRGTYVVGSARHEFGPGDFLFAPAGVVHRFERFSEDLAVWVFFYGPNGGERAGGPSS